MNAVQRALRNSGFLFFFVIPISVIVSGWFLGLNEDPWQLALIFAVVVTYIAYALPSVLIGSVLICSLNYLGGIHAGVILGALFGEEAASVFATIRTMSPLQVFLGVLFILSSISILLSTIIRPFGTYFKTKTSLCAGLRASTARVILFTFDELCSTSGYLISFSN